MIQTEPPLDNIEGSVHMRLDSLKTIKNICCGEAMLVKFREVRLSCENSIDATQHPIEIKIMAALLPLAQTVLHFFARLGPVCGYLRHR